MRKIFFICFLLRYSLSLLAQDSLAGRAAPGYRHENAFFSSSPSSTSIDTSLNEAELYNPMVKKYRLYQDLGNIGSPAQSLIYTPYNGFGFQLGTQAMQQYYKKSEDTKYYQAKRPYTDIQYVQGSKELLFLDLVQTQNINKRWNIGVDFRRISSLGYYTNQKTSTWSTRVFNAYESKNKRYVMLNNLIWNKGYAEMNGGLNQDSSYEALSGANKQVGVNLQGKGIDGGGGPRNYFRNTSFHTAQFWYWGEHKQRFTPTDTTKDFYSRAGIRHTLDVERYSFLYRDKDLLNKDFYPTFNFDTTLTYDSVHQFMVQNSITLFSGAYKQDTIIRKSTLFFSLTHQYIEIYQRTANVKYNNLSLNFTEMYKGLFPLITADYCIMGYNKGDYSLYAAPGFYSAKTNLDYRFKISTTAKEQDYLVNHFVSNHYLWDYTFKKTQTTNISFRAEQLKQTGWKFMTSLNLINQLVYFDSTALPVQYNKQIQVITASLSKSFHFGNFFLYNQFWYQYTDNKNVMRLPEFGLFERFYYEKRLFKKALLAQIGMDVSFYTSYYAKEFNPVTRQFQLQNAVKTGSYPIVDLFFNMQIKRAILFFKFDHANADLSGNNSYSSPHQPLPYRSFRLGIRWRMFD